MDEYLKIDQIVSEVKIKPIINEFSETYKYYLRSFKNDGNIGNIEKWAANIYSLYYDKKYYEDTRGNRKYDCYQWDFKKMYICNKMKRFICLAYYIQNTLGYVMREYNLQVLFNNIPKIDICHYSDLYEAKDGSPPLIEIYAERVVKLPEFYPLKNNISKGNPPPYNPKFMEDSEMYNKLSNTKIE